MSRVAGFERLVVVVVAVAVGCGCSESHDTEPPPSSSATVTPTDAPPPGVAPSLPAPGSAPPLAPTASATLEPIDPPEPPKPRCPVEMVLVRSSLCVDRYEATVVDDTTSQQLSPYYPPESGKAGYLEKVWKDLQGSGTALEQRTPLPPLPAWQKAKAMKPRAVSKRGVFPQAYASGKNAADACGNAGKRLCTRKEWLTACRGEEDRDFPYGTTYVQGRCNVVRDVHPGILLWENPSINHTDPRFNLMEGKTGPLLRRTGGTLSCASKWGEDAIYDMVGNVDEWIDDPEGTFVGAFYSRAHKDGCQAKVESHPFVYADYSTGIRCCAEPRP